jgi:hypothetical protein
MKQGDGARSDRGHVDGSALDVVAFAVPGGDGAVLAELAEDALDGVALLMRGGVEGGRPPARAAALEPVLHQTVGSSVYGSLDRGSVLCKSVGCS